MKTTPHLIHGPKILPWLAHKAGISMPRAETLWAAARRHAETATGEIDTPTTWQLAMDRLYFLIAAESLREDAAAFGWRNWSRLYKRICEAPVGLFNALTLNNVRGWRRWQNLHAG
jgi:hypothetical protein